MGTVGGGTHLPAQSGCLDICGVRGAAKGPNALPGDNSRKLAQIVGGAVLAVVIIYLEIFYYYVLIG